MTTSLKLGQDALELWVVRSRSTIRQGLRWHVRSSLALPHSVAKLDLALVMDFSPWLGKQISACSRRPGSALVTHWAQDAGTDVHLSAELTLTWRFPHTQPHAVRAALLPSMPEAVLSVSTSSLEIVWWRQLLQSCSRSTIPTGGLAQALSSTRLASGIMSLGSFHIGLIALFLRCLDDLGLAGGDAMIEGDALLVHDEHDSASHGENRHHNDVG